MSRRRIVVPTSDEYERGVQERRELIASRRRPTDAAGAERPAVHRLAIDVPERVARRPLRG